MLITIIAFILILSVLVFAHELGHFWTAKKFGAKAEEFGFGFPPRLFGWKKKDGKRRFFWGNGEEESEDTIWSLNWIPIGGFVKIKGEDGESKADPESFASKKPWQRGIILSAGVAMNVLLCIVCLIIAFMLGAPQIIENDDQIVKDPKIQVMSVLDNSPADSAGVTMGDVIVSIDGQFFNNTSEVQAYMAEKGDQEVVVAIERLGEQLEYKITAELISETGNAGLGVGLVKTGIVSYPWYKSIWLGLKGTWNMFSQIIVAFATIIKNAFTGEEVGADIAGPVGIAVITGRVARMGISYILQFTALLSMNLAIINFLPLPALDGGRVLFLIIEKIRGRAVNQKVEQIVHTIGFVLLMLLIVVVTGKDIWQFRESFINLWHGVFG
ncbi:RIP metalloprotease RseP [Candidatus Falkowbacteria bacterium]|jgi:regulator of sigma E protease|nr:RIP metalloprotease RseP [Candidatus Falkowbacteria bacterium]MBT7006926.1 RIP metalloprotease RseP [Candidatus Falkowbacteria bacterium]